MDNMHEILDEVNRFNQDSVLATIIEVEGSAYRKEGTSMLFLPGGRQIGLISAGCLEADLAHQAEKLLNVDDIHSRHLIYDTSAEDDLSWGRGAGCNGKVHILLEKVDKEMRDQLNRVREYLKSGRPVTIVKLLQDDFAIKKTLFITEQEQAAGHSQVQSTDQLAQLALKNKKACLHYLKDIQQTAFVQPIAPKPRVFLFGAGPDARPFASMAAKTGFSVHVWDWRPVYCSKDYFPEAHIMQPKPFHETKKEFHFVSTDSIVIMTHDFQKDKEIIHHMAHETQAAYLGILGPRKRTMRLLGQNEIPEHIHSPIGLSIGAEGPEEIAISIVADLVRAKSSCILKERSFSSNGKSNRYLPVSWPEQKVW